MVRLVVSLLFAVCAVAIAPEAMGSAGITRSSFTGATVTCSGELITVEVEVLVVERVSRDAQGVAHLGSTIITSFRGTSASGATYIGTAHQTTELRGDVGSETTHTETFNQNLIRLGEDGTADDLRGRAVFHFTRDANGNLVVSKFEFISECA
jgi:hypothetical protein